MLFRVLVVLKEEVPDASGRALKERLCGSGFAEVTGVRIGKYIELEFESGDRDYSERRVKEMCERLLANPLIEEYRLLEGEG